MLKKSCDLSANFRCKLPVNLFFNSRSYQLDAFVYIMNLRLRRRDCDPTYEKFVWLCNFYFSSVKMFLYSCYYFLTSNVYLRKLLLFIPYKSLGMNAVSFKIHFTWNFTAFLILVCFNFSIYFCIVGKLLVCSNCKKCRILLWRRKYQKTLSRRFCPFPIFIHSIIGCISFDRKFHIFIYLV